MPALNPSWTKLVTNQQLQRSSHNVSVIDSTVYIFGGELKPREPRDNDVHKIGLGQGTQVQTQSCFMLRWLSYGEMLRNK